MNARRMEYGAVDLIVDGDDYVAMKRENARLTEQVAALTADMATALLKPTVATETAP